MKNSSPQIPRVVAARQSPDGLAAQRRAAPRHRRAWSLWSASCRRLSCPLPDSRHSRDVLRRRPEHQVCGIGDSAIKTARIVLVIRTFEGPVLRATQNKLSFTMWHAAPKPACRPRCPSPSPETSPEIITDLPTLQALARPLRPPQPPAPPAAIARHDTFAHAPHARQGILQGVLPGSPCLRLPRQYSTRLMVFSWRSPPQKMWQALRSTYSEHFTAEIPARPWSAHFSVLQRCSPSVW